MSSLIWLPDLSPTTQEFIRVAYGFLLLATLVRAFPHGRRFFQSERWGGYGRSSPFVDLVQNPIIYPFLMATWLTSGLCLVLGIQTVVAALVNCAFCYYFFIWMRWRSVLRGMGAPGFMCYWVGAAIFLLEFTRDHAPQWRSFALLVLQIDFALIMLSAGIYKLTAGYARNDGMELGLVNPMWSYWDRFWAKVRPDHPAFALLNHLAWSLEILAALMMLLPATRFFGAMIVGGSFLFIATQIRLTLLPQMVMLGTVVFFAPGTLGQQMIDFLPLTRPATVTGWLPLWTSELVGTGLWLFLWLYLILLPLAHAGLFVNFYLRRRWWGPIQAALEAYTNVFGIIIWRVFSADHTCFFIRIWKVRPDGKRVLVSDYNRLGSRFHHVGESITLTSLFTSLKYYPTNDAVFIERMLRYARTLPCDADESLVFQYLSIVKEPERFTFVPVAEFSVDVQNGRLTERRLSSDADVLRSARPGSPLRPAFRPGTYAA